MNGIERCKKNPHDRQSAFTRVRLLLPNVNVHRCTSLEGSFPSFPDLTVGSCGLSQGCHEEPTAVITC